MHRPLANLTPLALWAIAQATAGATIRAVGVLGNSGVAGPALVRVGSMPLERCASGVAVDDELTLWASGGDAINRIGLDGRLIERFPLEPKGTIVDSRTFAVWERTLFFFGRLPTGRVALFRLPMRSGAVGKPLGVELPPLKSPHLRYCLGPRPLGDTLVLAAQKEGRERREIAIYFLDPDRPSLREAFVVPGAYPQSLAIDPRRGIIYLGAHFGAFVGGITHQNVFAIAAFRPDGSKASNAFPAPCVKTPALPTQFRGVVSLAAGALWDTAWYGFLARLDLAGRAAPGRVVQWHHELDYPTQLVGALDGLGGSSGSHTPLVIATPMPDAIYFAVWNAEDERLALVRRLGCLPVISSLGLSPDGWVTAGTARTQLWWRWEDEPGAPPRKTDIHLAITPLFFRGEQAFAIAAQYHLRNVGRRPLMATVFSRRPGGRNEARRVGRVPFEGPVGLSVRVEPGKPVGTLFVTDAASRRLWRTSLWLGNLTPDERRWERVELEGIRLESPTDVVVLLDGRLVLADRGRVVGLEPAGGRYRLGWELRKWGPGPADRFGSRLRLSLDGPWLLVSDTDRHRLLWFEWRRRRLVAQFGETDRPGADLDHLDRPAQISLRGTRAVVADRGNQRILKVRLEP